MPIIPKPDAVIGHPGNATHIRGEHCSAYVMGNSQIIEAVRLALPQLEISFDLDLKAFLESIPQHWGSSYAIAIENDTGTFSCLIADLFGGFPIYFTDTAWSFDLASILQNMDARHIDGLALQEYLGHAWLMEERTLVSGVRQVQPSHCVQIRAGQPPMSYRYASIDFLPSLEFANIDEAIARTSHCLDGYFSDLRGRSENIGIMFSGGVDSSLLLAKALTHGFKKIIAISPFFPGYKNPETERAEQVARHLGVEVRQVKISGSVAASAIVPAIASLERPLSYLNSLVRWKFFEDISSDVDIVLSGEGADCLFGSDELLRVKRYEDKQRALRRMSDIPRNILANLMEACPFEQISRRASVLRMSTIDMIRQSTELGSAPISLHNYESRQPYAEYEPNSIDSIMAVAQNRTLYTSNRNQFVTYNRLALSFGLSIEFPFLERNVASVGLTLADSIKQDRQGAKPVLKRLACRYMPAELVYAPKFDFRPPYPEWLGGPLSQLGKILTEERTLSRGIFDPDVIRKLNFNTDTLTMYRASWLEIFFRNFVDESPDGIKFELSDGI